MQRLVTVIMSLLLMALSYRLSNHYKNDWMNLVELARTGFTMTLIKLNAKPRRLIDLFFPSSAECRERRASTSTGRLSVRIQNWLI